MDNPLAMKFTKANTPNHPKTMSSTWPFTCKGMTRGWRAKPSMSNSMVPRYVASFPLKSCGGCRGSSIWPEEGIMWLLGHQNEGDQVGEDPKKKYINHYKPLKIDQIFCNKKWGISSTTNVTFRVSESWGHPDGQMAFVGKIMMNQGKESDAHGQNNRICAMVKTGNQVMSTPNECQPWLMNCAGSPQW